MHSLSLPKVTRSIFLIVVCLLQINSSFAGDKYSSIVYDMSNDKIVASKNINEINRGSVMVRLMTSYILCNSIMENRNFWSDKIQNNKHHKNCNTSLCPHKNDFLTVKNAYMGLIFGSINSPEIIGVYLTNEIETFVNLMNSEANNLKLGGTSFFINNDKIDAHFATEDIVNLAKKTAETFPHYQNVADAKNMFYRGTVFQNQNFTSQYMNKVKAIISSGSSDRYNGSVVRLIKDNGELLVFVNGDIDIMERDINIAKIVREFSDNRKLNSTVQITEDNSDNSCGLISDLLAEILNYGYKINSEVTENRIANYHNNTLATILTFINDQCFNMGIGYPNVETRNI